MHRYTNIRPLTPAILYGISLRHVYDMHTYHVINY